MGLPRAKAHRSRNKTGTRSCARDRSYSFIINHAVTSLLLRVSMLNIFHYIYIYIKR